MTRVTIVSVALVLAWAFVAGLVGFLVALQWGGGWGLAVNLVTVPTSIYLGHRLAVVVRREVAR